MPSETLKRARDMAQSLDKAPLIGGGLLPKVPDTRVTLTLTHDIDIAYQHRIIAARGDTVVEGEYVGVDTYASLIVEERLFIAVTDYFKGGPLVVGHVYEVKK